MKNKILLYYLILIIIGMSITGIFVSSLAQNLYKDEVSNRLLTVASLFDNELENALLQRTPIDYNSLAQEYAESIYDISGKSDISSDSTKPRITLIDYHGNVLGESQVDYSSMQNHLDRKEVQQAIKGTPGEDIRESTTLNVDFLYIAIPSSNTDLIIRTSMPLVHLKNINMQIWLYCLAGILAGLVFTLLLAVRFTNAITKPIGELTAASRDIADGNYSKRAYVTSNDEVGQLSSAFNEMAGKLDKTVSELTDKNLRLDAMLNSMTNGFIAVDSNMQIILANSIAEDFFHLDKDVLGKRFIEVIRNYRLNEILSKAIKENQSSVDEIPMSAPFEGVYRVYASPIKPSDDSEINSGAIITIHDITKIRKLEQIKTEFVSNVTHELKTPLTSIRGFIETLQNGAVNDPNVASQFLEIIDIEAERLTTLINDILQLSEIENNTIDTNISNHNLNEIITHVVSVLKGHADSKNVRMDIDAAPDIMISANRDRIEQMLINLIDNAIKYNIEDGSVLIKAVAAESKIIITVADTGIGIEQSHFSRIFERFYRVDKGRSRSIGGTGLGLSIVKHIAQLYNGDVQLKSEPGKGTEFTIKLPILKSR